MANSSTTFKKGHPGYKKKGDISQKTILWNELKDYFTGEGAATYLKHLKELDPLEFVKRYEAALEFFKPKLARSQVDVTSKGKSIIPILGGRSNDISTNDSDGETTETEQKD